MDQDNDDNTSENLLVSFETGSDLCKLNVGKSRNNRHLDNIERRSSIDDTIKVANIVLSLTSNGANDHLISQGTDGLENRQLTSTRTAFIRSQSLKSTASENQLSVFILKKNQLLRDASFQVCMKVLNKL